MTYTREDSGDQLHALRIRADLEQSELAELETIRAGAPWEVPSSSSALPQCKFRTINQRDYRAVGGHYLVPDYKRSNNALSELGKY